MTRFLQEVIQFNLKKYIYISAASVVFTHLDYSPLFIGQKNDSESNNSPSIGL